MRLPERGSSRDNVLARMRERKGADADSEAGRTWSLVYPAGEEVDDMLLQMILPMPDGTRLISFAQFAELLGRATKEEVNSALRRHAKDKELLTITWDQDKFLRGPIDDILQIDGLPFVDLCFNEDPEYYWCPSDVHHFEPQQIEINEARAQAAAHRRIAVVKWIAQTGMFE